MPEPDLTAKLAALDLQGVTISARVDAQGRLHPVAGGFDKLLGASQKRSLPRIHTVIVSAEAPGLPAMEDIDSTLRVIPARTIDEAIHLLLVDQQNRWGVIPDYSDILRRHRTFVGRQWLRDRVNTAIEQALADPNAPPYILITGRPGTGKTAFVANQVQNSPAAVYHFLRREAELDNPETMLRSLTRQLRRTHALAALNEEDSPPPAAFHQVMQRASDAIRHEETGERQVIWIDGLDEAFGPTGRFRDERLDSLLPLRGLPPGVVFVLTSRPDGPLGWLSDPLLCQRIDLDENREANLADIRQYLELQEQSLGLNLSPGLLQRLAQASEGCFVAAVRYLYPGPHLQANLDEWQRHPERIPSGLDGWLNYQWQVLLSASEEEAIPERVVYGVLGYVAMQEGIASRSTQEDLFKAMPRLILLFLRPGDIEQYLEPVLALSSEFFEPVRPGEDQSPIPRFFHSQFAEFIRNKVVEKSQEPVKDTPAEKKPGPGPLDVPAGEAEPDRLSPFFWVVVLVIGVLLATGAWYGMRQIWPPLTLPTPAAAAAIADPSDADPTPSPTERTATATNSPSPTSFPTLPASSTPLPASLAQVIADSTNLYDAPDADALILAALTKGDQLQIFGRSADGSWLVAIAQIAVGSSSTPGGAASGWVRAQDISFATPLEALREVLPPPSPTPTGAAPLPQAVTATPTRRPTARPEDTAPPPPTPYP